jgi:hypothetical protein
MNASKVRCCAGVGPNDPDSLLASDADALLTFPGEDPGEDDLGMLPRFEQNVVKSISIERSFANPRNLS